MQFSDSTLYHLGNDHMQEYETRQRAIRDYNIGMLTAERRGIEAERKIGREEGRAEGETLGVSRINQLILELSKHGRTEDIVKEQLMRNIRKNCWKSLIYNFRR